MITVTFTANNLFTLRDDIVKFLEDAGFTTTCLSPLEAANNRYEKGQEAISTYQKVHNSTTLTYSDDIQAEAQSVVAQLTQPEVTEPAPLASAPIAEEQAPIPEETQTEQPTASVSNASPPLTFEEVRLATLQLASKRGREAVMEVLAPYNVKRSSEVSEDLWPELIAKLQAAQNV